VASRYCPKKPSTNSPIPARSSLAWTYGRTRRGDYGSAPQRVPRRCDGTKHRARTPLRDRGVATSDGLRMEQPQHSRHLERPHLTHTCVSGHAVCALIRFCREDAGRPRGERAGPTCERSLVRVGSLGNAWPMEFFCYHRDRPGSTPLRNEMVEQHWSYMDQFAASMIARGPTSRATVR